MFNSVDLGEVALVNFTVVLALRFMKEGVPMERRLANRLLSVALSGVLAFSFVPMSYAAETSFDQGGLVAATVGEGGPGGEVVLAQYENPYEEGTKEAEKYDEESLEKEENLKLHNSFKWDELVEGVDYETGNIFVGVRCDTEEGELAELLSEKGFELSEVVYWEGLGEGLEYKTVHVSVPEGGVLDAIESLLPEQEVLFAEPNWIYALDEGEMLPVESPDPKQGTPWPDDFPVSGDAMSTQSSSYYVNDPARIDQWYIDQVNADDAWSVARANHNVTVAVLDTGVATTHNDLDGNLILDNGYVYNAFTGLSSSASIEDDHGHGTAVSGVVASEANNLLGIAGVTYNAYVLPVKVLDADCKGTAGKTVAGINHVCSLKTTYVSDPRIQSMRVINLSLSGYNKSAYESQAVSRARSAGMVVVCAAGNAGRPSWLNAPANSSDAICVAATDRNNARVDTNTWASNYGPGVTISAPGIDIYTTTKPNTYDSWVGTSFAAPIVSGVFALMFACDSSLTVDGAEAAIEATAAAVTGGTGPGTELGYGLVNALGAVEYVASNNSSNSLTHAVIGGVVDKYYTGSAITQSDLSVTLNGITLTQGTDYSVSYANNVNIGSDAVVTVTGIGSYTGTASKQFSVKSRWKRIFGENAQATMGQVLSEGFSGQQNTVVITTQDTYYDALTASALAGLYGCPIMTVPNGSLSDTNIYWLSQWNPSTVYIVGGAAALPTSIEWAIQSLVSGVSIYRISGATARGTAEAIYDHGSGNWGTTAIVATQESFQDALSISAYAYAKHAPIFLVQGQGGTLDSTAVYRIINGGFTRVVIVGGTEAVGSGVESQLSGITCIRRAGSNCYATSQSVATWCRQNGMTGTRPALATGEDYYDALVGAPLCGKYNSPIILATDYNLSTINGFVKTYRSYFQTSGYILGGDVAISYFVETKLNRALRNLS